MKLPVLVLAFVSVAAGQDPAGTVLIGTLDDRVAAEGVNAVAPLNPSTDRNLPGIADSDVVFRANLPQFRPSGAPNGLAVAYVQTLSDGWLFVDANVDGRFSESERWRIVRGAAE